MPKASVIVPVYNPGSNIDDLLRTVLDQSMPRSDYEVIFVDDGSTDPTPGRLDALAAEHESVRVTHIPNSGWAGLPRNVGLDMARGDYVLFMDDDDWLGREALERLVARAQADRADVVVGKVVGHGKSVPRALFRANRRNATLDWPPLVTLLSPHKLFRRAFLEEHGIRFPEGKRRLEDHLFVMDAYFHAASISVLADYPVYHWVLRDKSASFTPFDPAGYFGNVREVLDLIDEHTEPGPLRDQLVTNWYRGKVLKRVGGATFLRRETYRHDYSRELIAEMQRLAQERFGPAHEALLPFNLRVRSHLLRAGDVDGLHALAEFEKQLRARADVYVHVESGRASLRVDARLEGTSDPLRFRRDGDTLRWEPPPALRDRLPADALQAELTGTTAQVLVRAEDGSEYVATVKAEPRLSQEGVVVLAADAVVDPATGAGGGPLAAGTYGVFVNLIVAGFTKSCAGYRRGGRRGVRLAVDTNGQIAEATRRKSPPPTPMVRLKRRVKRLLGR